jgi:enoyl-[acyl-carrier-protein] reductase (NADH)
MKVLDLGCGDGTTALPEAKLGAEVLGVDISRNLVEAGNKRAREHGLTNLKFQHGDASGLNELEDQSFDLVVSIFGAMFAPRPQDVAKAMVRVVRPGGRIVMGNWIPNDPTLVAQILKISSAYTPPPPAGFVSPMTWGVEATVAERFERSRAEGRHPYIRTVMHSLAFGSLVPFITDDPKDAVDRKKMEMTQDVMANSLVYWVQDLYRGGFLESGSRVFAMTSEGSSRVVPSYGVVSSAKAALESHTRQLAMELARRGSGISVNCIQAGVTLTPALMKIPEHDEIIRVATARNPTGRLTTPADVANAIVALSGDGLEFISGTIVRVDGAEFVTG